MNKGLQAHLYSTIMYLIPISLLFIKSSSITNVVLYFVAVGYIIIQGGIAILSYLENWYD